MLACVICLSYMSCDNSRLIEAVLTFPPPITYPVAHVRLCLESLTTGHWLLAHSCLVRLTCARRCVCASRCTQDCALCTVPCCCCCCELHATCMSPCPADHPLPVSYKPLPLPTNRAVSLSAVPGTSQQTTPLLTARAIIHLVHQDSVTSYCSAHSSHSQDSPTTQ